MSPPIALRFGFRRTPAGSRARWQIRKLRVCPTGPLAGSFLFKTRLRESMRTPNHAGDSLVRLTESA
jgi:hypothetical protein